MKNENKKLNKIISFINQQIDVLGIHNNFEVN